MMVIVFIFPIFDILYSVVEQIEIEKKKCDD